MKLLINFIENLKNYSYLLFKKLFLVIQFLISYDNVVNSCKLFNMIDSNNDGKITEKEL